jgi:alkylated DNA repair protein alkB family protein 6
VPFTDSAYYIKDYLSTADEKALLDCIFNLDQDRWFEMKSGRSLKRYGGEVGPKGGLISQELLPNYFQAIGRKLYEEGLFKCDHGPPNHVLLNKYRPGEGIMPHKDGPAYHPFVCILSLHTGLTLNIWESLEDVAARRCCKARFYLEPRSLFIFTDSHYREHFHGIEECVSD